MRLVLALGSLLLTSAIVACGGTTNNSFYLGVFVPDAGTASSGTTGSGVSTGGGSAGGASTSGGGSTAGGTLPDGGSINDAAATYLADLPGWPSPAPSYDGPVDGGVDAGAPNYVSGDNGVEYLCSTTEYSLTSTPTQIVTFNPNVDVLWPGALLQGGPFQQGILSGLPITQRAPLTVSIPTLLSASNNLMVQQPTVATVEGAIGAIVAAAVDAGVQASSSVSYTQTDAYTASQTALSLGFSASYIGGDLSGQLNLAQSANLHSVVGYFVQNMFTVTVPEPEQPGDLFSGLTTGILNPLIAAGDVGPTNLPIYVASVTYGRLMMFSITSQQSTEQISTALNSQFHGGFASGSVSSQYAALLSDSSTTFSVVTVGGAAANAEALISTGDPTQFFTSDPPISTGVPISYVVRNLSNNSVAGVSQTTTYAVQSCSATTTGPGASVYIADNVAQAVQAYDLKGNKVSLTRPVQADNGYAFYGGIAYDRQDDLLFVAEGPLYSGLPPSTPSKVLAFLPDGTPLANDSFTGPGLFGSSPVPNPEIGSLSYDPTYDRLWVAQVSPANVLSYTPTGEPNTGAANLFCNSNPIYVPSVNELFCFSTTGTSAWSFGTFTPVTLPAAFANVDSRYPAYDSADDLIFLVPTTSVYGTTIASYTPQGTLVTTIQANAQVAALGYDEVDNQIYAACSDGIIEVFKPDGTPVSLKAGAFPNFAAPRGIAIRP